MAIKFVSKWKNPHKREGLTGGPERIRTADGDFADLCLTTWRRGHQK